MKESGDRVIGGSGDLRKTPLLGFWRIARATVREIFDESAYDRYLSQTHTHRSGESYRAFLREREAAMARKPRCC